MEFLVYSFLVFVKVFIKVAKNILVIKSTKMSASIVFAIGSVVSVVMTKVVVKLDMLTACLISALVNFVACYSAMSLYDKSADNKTMKNFNIH